MKHGLKWTWESNPPPFKQFFQPETPLLREYVSSMLLAGAVEETKSLAFQGPLFTVSKKDSDKRRVILDLSTLNKFITCPRFKMTTINDVRRLLPKGAFTTSIDLQDAYWHVPVHPHFRRFLGFRLGKKKYRFRCLPFGLNIAPRIFTKLGKAVLKELRLKGIRVLAYLDDWLIWGESKEECERATKIVLKVLAKRGFLVNLQKSRLTPKRRFQWLGILWDTNSFTLQIPADKRKSIKRAIRLFQSQTWVSRRQLERILGSLQFAAVVDPVGKAALKDLNRYFRAAARNKRRDRLWLNPPSLRSSLKRWLRPGILAKKICFRPPPPSVEVTTDASLSGWGFASSLGHRHLGKWSPHLQGRHINILELAAILIALKAIHLPPGTHVRVHSDNLTAVNCLCRQGSARSPPLNSWVRSILHLVSERGLFLTTTYIKGVHNVIADSLSRDSPLPSEWRLDRQAFKWILRQGLLPEVDLFATAENHQLPVYVSPSPDPKAVSVDALRTDWNQWKVVYLFPPTPLILRALVQLESFQGRALLVTPDWPNQPWYPELVARAETNVLIPQASLSQQVGVRTCFAVSPLYRRLRLWIL